MVGTFAIRNANNEVVTDEGSIKAEVDGAELKYSFTAPPSNGVNSDLIFGAQAYSFGFSGTITGTAETQDGGSVTADAMVTIMLNRPPQLKGTGSPREQAFVLGTQDKDREEDEDAEEGRNKLCDKVHECELDVFDDQDDITVSVTKMTVDGVVDTSKVGWEVVPATDDAKATVKLMGLANTYTGDQDAAEPVTVTLKAVDSNGLDTEATVMVNVDPAPTASSIGMRFVGSSHDISNTLRLISSEAADLFDNDGVDAVTLTVVGASDPEGAVTVVAGGSGVVLTGVVLGPATVTLTATESGDLAQTAEIEFNANVTQVGE
jgi:hypothetical protein